MKRTLITIAIPFMNPGSFLADAVRSVFAQTVSDWEFILVDDGSTDDSVQFARQISKSAGIAGGLFAIAS